MTPLEALVSPGWVLGVSKQEDFPSHSVRPAVGTSLCEAEAYPPFPSPAGSFYCQLEWTVSDLASSLLRCLPAEQMAGLPVPGSHLRVGALKWDPPVPLVQCGLPGRSR